MLAAILITMGFDAKLRVSWEYGVPWVVLISAAYFLRRARRGRIAAATSATGLGAESARGV